VADKRLQKSGHSSLNVQGEQVTLGLSFADARQVALDVFDANFYRLERVARDTAHRRADELVDKYLKSLQQTSSVADPLAELQNPDMQYVLYSAQREYARSGDADLGELLVSLLVERTKMSERSLLQIVLNEAVGAVSKLTIDQLDILSLVFVLRYSRRKHLSTANDFLQYLDETVLPFLDTPSIKQSAYQHLEFAGCASIDMGHVNLERLFLGNYPGLFCGGFLRPMINSLFGEAGPPSGLLIPSFHQPERYQVAAIDEPGIRELANQMGLRDQVTESLVHMQKQALLSEQEVRDFVVRSRPAAAKLFSLWSESAMQHLKLTSVGIAIGHANMERRVGIRFDLTIWI
jgi:hypothetical protein